MNIKSVLAVYKILMKWKLGEKRGAFITEQYCTRAKNLNWSCRLFGWKLWIQKSDGVWKKSLQEQWA